VEGSSSAMSSRVLSTVHRLCAVSVLLAAAGCGDSQGPPTTRIEAVELDTRAVVVELMGSAEVSARVRTNTGAQLRPTFEWSCTRPELVASCGPRIEPRDTGSFMLIARAGGFADTAHVRIYEEGMRAVTVMEPFPSLGAPLVQGGTLLIKLQITDSAGVERLDRRVRWQVSDSTIATVRDTVWWQGGTWRPGGMVRTGGAGAVTVTATVGGASAVVSAVVRPRGTSCDGRRALPLDLDIGELHRFRGSDPALPSCLQFRRDRDDGRRYLVMVERLPRWSGSLAAGRRGLHFADGAAAAADSVIVQLYTAQLAGTAMLSATLGAALAAGPAPAHAHREWQVSGLTLGELPPDPTPALRAVRRGGPAGEAQVQAQPLPRAGATAGVGAGDTLVIPLLATLARDAIRTGPPSELAVVRFVGEHLVFAEHVELFGTDMRRHDGQLSAPIPEAEYARIDAAYRTGSGQLHRLFGPPATAELLLLPPGRELVVNAILPRGTWGTAAGDMAFVDYWSGTDGRNPGVLQDPLLVANQIITHELAHVRHFQHQPTGPLLPWSVEGAARFAEHLAFAATVLGNDAPSRTGNAVAGLAGYPTSPSTQFNSELPSALGLDTNFFGGYSAAAYIFDYLADHVEAAGGDGLRAVRDVLLGAWSAEAASTALARHFGPVTLDEVITRARIALVLDDHPGLPGLPRWTQYLQFDLPASRMWHLSWPRAVPGVPFMTARQVGEGLVWGAFIDGDRAVGDQDFLLDMTPAEQSVLSVVRIR
jgi:hypothetical protein